MNVKVPQIDYNEAIKSSGLLKKLLFVLFALLIYRFGTFIPVPGVNSAVLEQIFSQHQGGILGIFDMFTGGALMRFSIFALGVMPYISASIIMTLLQTSFEHLKSLKEQGAQGRKKIQEYTRYFTVLLALLQSYGISNGILNLSDDINPILGNVFFFQLSAIICMTSGTIFLVWLGDQISENGLGSGISVLIFAGIVANLPFAVVNFFDLGRTGAISSITIVFILFVLIFLIIGIVFVERSQRRLLVQYPKRQVGNKVFGGQSSYLPIKLNISGVIPAIFASSLLLLPTTLSNLSSNNSGILYDIGFYFQHGKPLYMIFLFSMIIFFAFFYTAIVFNPKETADNLKKYGGFVPGIRPGENTANYLDYVLTRLTVVGAIYLSAVCLLPELLIAKYKVPFYFGGTSLLIVVSVTMDTVQQIQSYLIAHQYEGLIKKSSLRNKRRWLILFY